MNEELKKWIADYDNGNVMESVLMGGLYYGYEVAIQDCAIEIMRNLQTTTPPEDDEAFKSVVEMAVDTAANSLDEKHGFSGAQVGAAKNLACVFWKQTPSKAIEMMKKKDPDRIMKIWKSSDGMLELDSSKVESD